MRYTAPPVHYGPTRKNTQPSDDLRSAPPAHVRPTLCRGAALFARSCRFDSGSLETTFAGGTKFVHAMCETHLVTG